MDGAAEAAPVEVLSGVWEDGGLGGGLQGDVAEGDFGVAGAGDDDGEELVEDAGDARGGEDELVVVRREGDFGELGDVAEGGGGRRREPDVDRQVGGEGVRGEELPGGRVRGMIEGEVVEAGGRRRFGLALEVSDEGGEGDGVRGALLFEL